MNMKTYKQLKTELLKDKEIKRNYKELCPEFSLIEIIIRRRIKKGLTQRDLAQKIGTKQSAISRLESGTYNPTFSFLQKLADALGVRLKISLMEK